MKLRSGREANQKEKTKNVESEKSQAQPKAQTLISQSQATSQESFNKLYSNLVQPGAYTRRLLHYLRKNRTHSIHKNVIKKFPRRKIITHYPGQITQSDLIDMQKFSGSNAGFNYILVFIDCFSKKLWVEPLKSKTGHETANALRAILNRVSFPIQSLIQTFFCYF